MCMCMHARECWKLGRPASAYAHIAACSAVRCLWLSMVARPGLTSLGVLAALLSCADMRSLRLSPFSNGSSVPHTFSRHTLQCSQGSGVLEGARSAACALLASEPVLQSGLSCTVCERLPPHAFGNIADQADAANTSVAANGPAWETLFVIGCGDFLGNIVRGVTGAALHPGEIFTRAGSSLHQVSLVSCYSQLHRTSQTLAYLCEALTHCQVSRLWLCCRACLSMDYYHDCRHRCWCAATLFSIPFAFYILPHDQCYLIGLYDRPLCESGVCRQLGRSVQRCAASDGHKALALCKLAPHFHHHRVPGELDRVQGSTGLHCHNQYCFLICCVAFHILS